MIASYGRSMTHTISQQPPSPSPQPTAPSSTTELDGRHDFDFWMGTWSQRNRRLTDALDPACDQWVEFASTAVAWPTLGGLGNVDTLSTDEFPGQGRFEGMSWRLFEPATGLWRIWWASSTRPAVVDPPVVGRFDGGVGVFECDDEIGGVPLRVRYEWRVTGADEAHWQQAFSFDAGATWHVNWTTLNTRVAALEQSA